MTLTPEQRSLRARIAAHKQHAAGRTNTGPARRAFMARFEDEVDPTRKLPTEERRRRAEQARRAYFTALALRSSVSRSRNTRPGDNRPPTKKK